MALYTITRNETASDEIANAPTRLRQGILKNGKKSCCSMFVREKIFDSERNVVVAAKRQMDALSFYA